MPRQMPHPKTICHLVPDNESLNAKQMLLHPDNMPFVSLCKATETETPAYGLEIGHHVSSRPRSLMIVEVGKNADLVMPGASISRVQFSFEIHPESRLLMFWDRSRLCNTKVKPHGFRTDGNFRQFVLDTKRDDYQICAGGQKADQYIFHLRWYGQEKQVAPDIRQESQMVEGWVENPRWARTVEDGPTDLPTWYNTRLHTPTVGVIQQTLDIGKLGNGAFGEVWKVADRDSGCLIAAKRIHLPQGPGSAASKELVRREIKVFSSISHKNIVEYLGCSGWDTGTVSIYMSLKRGNLCDLLETTPSVRDTDAVLIRLWHEMLEALDYFAFRGWIHRDVKLENILYTPVDDDNYLFQLADFDLANHQSLAKTQCGSPIYMVPEIVHGKYKQSPKSDVWSLFIVLGVVTRAGGLHPGLTNYEDVLKCARAAANRHQFLSPMAQEDPNLRASAAQMLVQYFKGEGLSTPRNQIPGYTSVPAPAQPSD